MEDFDLTKLKRNDILHTFTNEIYIYVGKGNVYNPKRNKIGSIKNIMGSCLEIKKIIRDFDVIANRKRFFDDLRFNS